MVDRVELPALDHPQQVRELEGRYALRLQDLGEARREVEDVGHVGKHVVRRREVGPVTRRGEPPGGVAAEEGDVCGHPALDGDAGDVGRRLDAEHRHALGDEVLQQVAVVARDLDDLTLGSETEALDHRCDVGLRVPQPTGGEAGEVGVIRKDRLGALEGFELHQPAGVADIGVERVENLAPVAPLRRDIGIGERREAEIAEGSGQGGAAGAAGRCGHARAPGVWPRAS